jgi:hypothetical protein
MRICGLEHNKAILTALKKADFKVVEVVKQGKKTVITVASTNGCQKPLPVAGKNQSYEQIEPHSFQSL